MNDSLTKAIELEGKLQKLLGASGENIMEYFNQNPEKKNKHIEECVRMREEIMTCDIPNAYKDPMVGSINKHLEKLTPKKNDLEELKESLLRIEQKLDKLFQLWSRSE